MITQNSLMNFLTKVPLSSQNITLSVGVEKSSALQFKETFKKAVDKVEYKDVNKSNRLKTKEDGYPVKAEGQERFNSYREAQINDKYGNDKDGVKSTKNSSDKVSGTEKDLDKNGAAKKHEDKVKSDKDIPVDVLANILGMDLKDLTKVLKDMNIKPEDLTDSTKTSDIIDKMSELLELNGQQKQALADLLNLLKSQLDSPVEKPSLDAGIKDTVNSSSNLKVDEKADPNKVSNQKVDAVESGKALSEAEKLIAQFKSKLEELTNKFIKSPESVSSDLAEEIKKVMTQYKTQNLKAEVKVDTEDNGQDQKAISSGNKEGLTTNAPKEGKNLQNSEKQYNKDVKAEDKSADEDNKTGIGNTEEPKKDATVDLKTIKQQVVQGVNTKGQDNNTTEVNSLLQNQDQKTGGLENTGKVHKEIPVSKNDVFSQIVEKAKVVTNGEKAEMLIDLKPDSLGKLSLKIITENGIVTAKFVAESQQVKEVIESNMQLLKDSLEKQGLSIQGFSVSVDQQSSKGFREEHETNNSKTLRRTDEIVGSGIHSIHNEIDRINPYNRSESRINLTA